MPTTPLPSDPSFENLKKQAKTLRRAVLEAAAGTEHAEAIALVSEFHPRASAALADFALGDAQLVIARRYGFASWPRLKKHVEAVHEFSRSPHVEPAERRTDLAGLTDEFLRHACLIYGGDHVSRRAQARKLLAEHPEIGKSFFVQVAIGDASAVEARLKEAPQLARTQGGPHRWEPLLYACYSRIDDVVDWPPQYSTLEVARLLLAHGADSNAGYLWEGVYPFTALTGVFGEGESGPKQQPPHKHCEALARLLLDAGADPNDSQALYNRMFTPNDDHLRLLFAYGLGQDHQGPWLARLGGQQGSPVQMLVEQLRWAASNGYFERIKLLVEHGAPVDAASERDGRTPYETAVLSGNREIADYLLQHGAKKAALSPREEFESACVAGDSTRARALLERDPGLLYGLGLHGRAELLSRAVDAGKQEGVRLMAALGFDLDAMMQTTVMHQAAWRGDLAMVKLLIDLGAAINLRERSYDATPLGWANYNGQKAVVEFLLTHADVFDAVEHDQLERVRALLSEDPALARARDRLDRTPLFRLRPEARHGEEMIRALMAAGAEVDARDRDGKTALDWVKSLGRDDLAEELRR